MARTTVEDCIKNIPNRYDLVLLASKRTHQLNLQARPMVDVPTHGHAVEKPTVTSLREIAAGMVDYENIESLKPGGNKNIAVSDAFISHDERVAGEGVSEMPVASNNPYHQAADAAQEEAQTDTTDTAEATGAAQQDADASTEASADAMAASDAGDSAADAATAGSDAESDAAPPADQDSTKE